MRLESTVRVALGVVILLGAPWSVFGQQAGPSFTPYSFSTLTGKPPPAPGSSLDGIGSNAQFDGLQGVAVDRLGNVYVADTLNNVIRKVSPTGSVTTLAGSAVVGSSAVGSADGVGQSASFSNPTGIAIDASGNVLVADTGNCTIRKISPSGVVTTLAGIPSGPFGGSADGQGPAARFFQPGGLAVDGSGFIYVADTDNNTIRKIDQNGVVTTIAGVAGFSGSADGVGSNASFNHPWGVAVDESGNIYVSDTGNNTIRKITPTGLVSTLAGSPGLGGSVDGNGSDALFLLPMGITIDANNTLYVTDAGNDTIRAISQGGTVSTIAGVAGNVDVSDVLLYGEASNGIGAKAHYQYPTGIAIDNSGTLYIGDTGNNELRKLGAGVTTTLAGSVSATAGFIDGNDSIARFFTPVGIATDSIGDLYVADQTNDTIRKIVSEATVSTLAGSIYNPTTGSADGTGTNAQFNLPSGLVADDLGNCYVTDGQRIRKISANGVVTTIAGSSGPGSVGSMDGTGSGAQFNNPQGIARDSSGFLYVADSQNNTVRKISPGFEVTTLAGIPGAAGYQDGSLSVAEFSDPTGVAVDSKGNVFVADTGNNVIREIAVNGSVTTLAGSVGTNGVGNNDGVGASVQFRSPRGLCVDSNGNIFVADTRNNEIRRVSPTGMVTTLGGAGPLANPGTYSYADGIGAAALFNRPTGIAVDAAGNIYVSDSNNNVIRKGTAVPPAGLSVVVTPQMPASSVVNGGQVITLVASASGSPTSYQWYLNSLPISGATEPTYALFATAANQGFYSVIVSNAMGFASGSAGTLTVATNSWLTNISARAFAHAGSTSLIAGFVTTGSTSKSVLVRGAGPSLAAFGVSNFLQDPLLTVVDGVGNDLEQTSSWDTTLQSVFTQVGAFDFTPGSADTAILAELPTGAYTTEIASKTTNTGVALAEIYDADSQAPSSRLVNISARAFVDAGSNILIGGFVITGQSSLTVIVRADGPALSGFGVSDYLSAPSLELLDGTGTVISSNKGWSNPPTWDLGATGSITIQGLTPALSAKVGAFAIPEGSNDSALVATLPAGRYTAQISSSDGGNGVAILEVYELR